MIHQPFAVRRPRWGRQTNIPVQTTCVGIGFGSRVDINDLARCAACGACLDDCPVATSCEDFDPNEIVKRVLEGQMEDVLAEGKFWQCLDCLTCFELCPQRFGMQSLFSKLKEIASERGEVPETLLIDPL